MANRPILQAAPQRLWLIMALFVLIFLVLSGRLVQLGLRHHDDLRLKASARTRQAVERPEIHDRKGRVLAMDVPTSSLYADPQILIDVDEAVEKLATVLPRFDSEKVRRSLLTKRRFVWIRRFLTPDQRKAVFDLGLPGLYFLREPKRFYPLGAQAAHLVGTVDRDNKGLSGLELYVNRLMEEARSDPEQKAPLPPVVLSLDIRVQNAVDHEIEAAMQRYKAKGGVGLVLDIQTGEVLAMVSRPSFDPLRPREALQANHLNRAMRGVYELGSVMKSFTIAMGLDSGLVGEQDRFDVATPVKLGRFVIKDHHKTKDGTMSVSEIFTHSSNVGAARIARKVGVEGHRAFLSRLHLLQRLRTEAGNAGLPLQPSKWRLADSLSIAYGYRLSVSPLQLASAAMALFNGGNRQAPHFLRQKGERADLMGVPVLKSATSRFMRQIMRANVQHGTGRAADIKGYEVGGKTGTARKFAKGGYGKQLITSFMAIFPSNKPRYLTYVMLDEPQKVKASHMLNNASTNAAPTTGKIITRIAPLLHVYPR